MLSENDHLVSFQNIQKSYDGNLLVVKNLNLDIKRGEFLTLLGPSGSGKSTCLMMLAGFEVPTRGDITLNGKRLNSVPPYKRNIGMVFQNYALFPHMTVAENLAFPLKVRKLDTNTTKEKVERVLEMVKLQDFANRFPGQLSGGQQQRVALARALVFEPELVLMDEPLGALDKQLREHMQMEIKHIHESLGVTVVYVTHDQSEALTMSDRVAVFNDGIIQQIAPPRELYEKPENSFVAFFIGENNTLHGKIESINDNICDVRLDNGALVRATGGPLAKVGDFSSLSIRPERVMINAAAREHDGFLVGTIQEFIYLGDHVRVRVDVAGNDTFIVKVPIADFDDQLAIGMELPLAWSHFETHALDSAEVSQTS